MRTLINQEEESKLKMSLGGPLAKGRNEIVSSSSSDRSQTAQIRVKLSGANSQRTMKSTKAPAATQQMEPRKYHALLSSDIRHIIPGNPCDTVPQLLSQPHPALTADGQGAHTGRQVTARSGVHVTVKATRSTAGSFPCDTPPSIPSAHTVAQGSAGEEHSQSVAWVTGTVRRSHCKHRMVTKC